MCEWLCLRFREWSAKDRLCPWGQTLRLGVMVIRYCVSAFFRRCVLRHYSAFFFFLRRRPYAVQRASALVLLVLNCNTLYFFVSPWWAWLGAMLLRHLTRFVASFTPLCCVIYPAFWYLFASFTPPFIRQLPYQLAPIYLPTCYNYPTFFWLAVIQIIPFRGPNRPFLLRIQVFRQALLGIQYICYTLVQTVSYFG